MQRHEALIDQEAKARDILESKNMRQELRSWKEESLDKINILDKEQSAKEFQAIVSWLRVDESDQMAIFESYSSQGNKHPGTCSWILKNSKITSWIQRKPETPFIWLSGTAGSGKSVISTQIINFIRGARMNVLSHFCTYSSAASSEYDQILRSLLEQLLRQDADLATYVYKDYVLKKQSVKVSSLETLLQTLLTSSSCDPSNINYIWIVLSRAAASGKIVCKVLVSSRSTPTLSRALRAKPSVSLTEEKAHLKKAIQEYAGQRLRSMHTRFEQLGISSHDIDAIGWQITGKADGMFIY